MSFRLNHYLGPAAIAGTACLFFYAPTSFSTPLNYPGSGSQVVSIGAEANCGDGFSGSPSTIDPYAASCSGDGNATLASADLPSAELKVFTTNTTVPGSFSSAKAQAGFVDLVTVTDGFDSSGIASGTFDLSVDGLFDVSDPDNDNGANFFIAIWGESDPLPPCIFDADDCFFTNPEDFVDPIDLGDTSYPFLDYDFAEVWFDFSRFNSGSPLEANIYSNGTGSGDILSTIGSDLRATLSVGWTVSLDSPSYYIAAMGYASNFGSGTSDFYNTARASLAGPDGFEYTSQNGFGDESFAVPVPSTIALIALGMTCLGWSRRKKV